MVYNDVRKNENKGFSLVELIVVIAIMAVLVAVLAPSLLQYVERSRAQKDDSAMGEVTNAIMLALSDQDVYDEVLSNSIKNNVSCYVDDTTADLIQNGAFTSDHPAGATIVTTSAGNTNGNGGWIVDDNGRLEDEQSYTFSGKMRGLTITFHPGAQGSNSSVFTMAAGKVNEGVTSSSEKTYSGKTLAESQVDLNALKASGNANTYLYNRLRATIGDTVTLTSQTYRNSNYTVFIRMGSTGGNEASAQDAIAVYGQWSGTNLFSAS
jgi:type IV pilus assembly protein PilA